MRIHAKVYGQGPDIVLIHGWGCYDQHMLPIVEHLEGKFTVTNISLPGSSSTDWHAPKDVYDIADHLVKALPKKKAIYIGWSFGGMIAAAIAAHHPDRVKHFIGITTTPRFVEANDWAGIPAPGFEGDFNVTNKEEFLAMLQHYADFEFADQKSHSKEYKRLLEVNKSSVKYSIAALNALVRICDATDIRQEYSKIKCPMDFILTDKDSTIPVAAHAAIKKLRKDIHVHVLPDAKHMPFWTHPKEFFAVLDKILHNAKE